MGDVIELSPRRCIVTRKDQLIAIVMRSVPEDHSSRAEYEAAVRELVMEPVNANFDLTTVELDHVEFFLRTISNHTELKRDEALLVSVIRMQKQTKWAFLEDPRIVRFARLGPAQYLTYLHVMGTLALAWQVHAHPRDIVLQVAVLRNAC